MTVIFKNEVPYIEGINLNTLVKQVPTPFYVYSQKSIEEAYFEIKNKLKKKIFYSIKANSNQAIIAFISSFFFMVCVGIPFTKFTSIYT